MALSDRDYARRDSSRAGLGSMRGLSVNTWIIVVNVGVFLLGAAGLHQRLEDLGYLSTFMLVKRLEFWRVITFQFLHANIWHIAMNMLGLYMFGGLVEQHLGSRRYAAFYLVCGMAGRVMYLLLNLGGLIAVAMGWGQIPILLKGSSDIRLVGASAGVFGVIMACAYIAPNAVVQLIFPPIPIRLKLLAYGYVAIAAINVLAQGQNAGGDAAHLGGAIAGYFFIRRSHLLHDFFEVFSKSGRRAPARRAPARAASAREVAEVDRILDKVRSGGLASLSEGEKETLRRATEAQRVP